MSTPHLARTHIRSYPNQVFTNIVNIHRQFTTIVNPLDETNTESPQAMGGK